MKGKWCVSAVAATLFACSLACGAAWGQRIHVLVVGDTSKIDGRGMANGIADSVKADVTNVQKVFAANIPERQLELKPLTGRDVSAEEIERVLRQDFSVNGGDAFVFYFAGHGYYADRAAKYITPSASRDAIHEIPPP
jgi:hypothetical protein